MRQSTWTHYERLLLVNSDEIKCNCHFSVIARLSLTLSLRSDNNQPFPPFEMDFVQLFIFRRNHFTWICSEQPCCGLYFFVASTFSSTSSSSSPSHTRNNNFNLFSVLSSIIIDAINFRCAAQKEKKFLIHGWWVHIFSWLPSIFHSLWIARTEHRKHRQQKRSNSFIVNFNRIKSQKVYSSSNCFAAK